MMNVKKRDMTVCECLCEQYVGGPPSVFSHKVSYRSGQLVTAHILYIVTVEVKFYMYDMKRRRQI